MKVLIENDINTNKLSVQCEGFNVQMFAIALNSIAKSIAEQNSIEETAIKAEILKAIYETFISKEESEDAVS
jgi:hypothetical protein